MENEIRILQAAVDGHLAATRGAEETHQQTADKLRQELEASKLLLIESAAAELSNEHEAAMLAALQSLTDSYEEKLSQVQVEAERRLEQLRLQLIEEQAAQKLHDAESHQQALDQLKAEHEGIVVSALQAQKEQLTQEFDVKMSAFQNSLEALTDDSAQNAKRSFVNQLLAIQAEKLEEIGALTARYETEKEELADSLVRITRATEELVDANVSSDAKYTAEIAALRGAFEDYKQQKETEIVDLINKSNARLDDDIKKGNEVDKLQTENSAHVKELAEKQAEFDELLQVMHEEKHRFFEHKNEELAQLTLDMEEERNNYNSIITMLKNQLIATPIYDDEKNNVTIEHGFDSTVGSRSCATVENIAVIDAVSDSTQKTVIDADVQQLLDVSLTKGQLLADAVLQLHKKNELLVREYSSLLVRTSAGRASQDSKMSDLKINGFGSRRGVNTGTTTDLGDRSPLCKCCICYHF
jgi:hypothetical protein